MLQLDHIAFTAPSREVGRAAFAEATGVILPDGGQHPAMGTHNAVGALGGERYVEVIAIDPEGEAPVVPRWFGLDDRPQEPALGPPIILYSSDDIESDLARAAELGLDLGHPISLSRGDLAWRFALRPDGSLPERGGAPILLEWTHDGAHPATNMADTGLRLSRIALRTTAASAVTELLRDADFLPDIWPVT